MEAKFGIGILANKSILDTPVNPSNQVDKFERNCSIVGFVEAVSSWKDRGISVAFTRSRSKEQEVAVLVLQGSYDATANRLKMFQFGC